MFNPLDTDGFVPRWDCGDWSNAHGWTHIVADLAIFAAYTSIPCALAYFILKRKDMPFPPIFWLFGAFILACGMTHFVEAVIFWQPVYRLAGVVKVITAVASWATVIVLIRLLPRALELPGMERVRTALEDEIAEKRKVEAELRRVMALDAAVLDAALDAMISMDLKGRVLAWNRAAERIFGYSAKAALGKSLESLIIPERLREAHRMGLERFRLSGQGTILDKVIEMPALHSSGAELTVELFIRRLESGGVVQLTAFLHDITERKAGEAQRLTALAETETLLKEVHHRVKNNMQVVSCLLSIHSDKLRDPAQRAVLDDCRDRIHAMALIHERLYTAGQFSRIEFAGYIADMVRSMLASSVDVGNRVTLDLQLEPLDVTLDIAVPLGLIASELVLNALKHGLPAGRAGTLRVMLKAGESLNELTVQDDGPGLPPGFTTTKSEGIGMELVQSLTRQIRGHLEFVHGGTGATVVVRWPAIQPQPTASDAITPSSA